MTPSTPHSSRYEGLPIALLGGLLLLVGSFWHAVVQWTGTLESNNALGMLQNGGSLWGSRLGWQIAGFVAAQLALHLGAATACWLLARAARRAWPGSPTRQAHWTLLWLLLGTLWVLLANAAQYPRSTFGDHLYQFARLPLPGAPVYRLAGLLLALLAGATLAMAAWRSLRDPLQAGSRPVGWRIAAVLGMAGITAAVALPTPGWRVTAPAGDIAGRPNVILLGIDSLRCDVAVPGMAGRPALATEVEGFLRQATHFTDAMTPLARTYPSWISILTGRHPHTTGAFMNLLHRDQLQLGDTLPAAMRRAGYRTLYAIDETRFSNIDESYGFDRAITPPMGAGDFLLGAINDAPLANVVVNTWLGAWLFPFSHANRAAATVYDPDSFVRRLEREADFDRPTFLALHLTLAHWPYVWADATEPEIRDPKNWTAAHYRPAVRRVDRQFADVLEVLRRKGALDNAIVVVLSDHGEALGQPGDSPFAMSGPAEDPFAWSTITGHGTSVLSPHQYRVVLGLRGFGPAARLLGPARQVTVPVTLEDLAPTLDELLGLRMRDRPDGRSLVPLLAGAQAAPTTQAAAPASAWSERIRFTETEFNPRGFQPGERQTGSAVQEALKTFELDRETGRLNIRRNERAKLLRQRQYAAIRGPRMIAAIPGNFTPGFRYLYVDGKAPFPRALEAPPAATTDPEAAELWQALAARFPEAVAGWTADRP